jgi:WD40 repeat protein
MNGPASGTVAALANAVVNAGLIVRLRVATLLLFTVCMGGVGLAITRPTDEPIPQVPNTKSQEQKAKSKEQATDAHGDALPPGAIARLGTVRFNHGEGLNALYFLPDGKTILSEGGSTICRWDADSGKEVERAVIAIPSFEDRFSVNAYPSFDDQTCLAPDGKTLLSLNQGWEDSIRVWDIGQRKEVTLVKIPLHRGLQSVNLRNAISSDGKLCALNMEKDIRVLEFPSAKELWKLPFEKSTERPLTFAGPDLLVTAEKKHDISIREARTGKLVRQFKQEVPVEVLVASPDGKRLATLEHHNHAIDKLLDKDVIHVWDVATGKEQYQLAAQPKRWYMELRFAPDGKRLLSQTSSGFGGELTLWDLETGKRLRDIPGATGQVMVVSPDGQRLACGVALGKFELYDLKDGKRISPGHWPDTFSESVVLSSDGAQATTFAWASLNTLDTSTGRRLRSTELPHSGFVSPCPSPNGRYVLTNRVSEFEVTEIGLSDAGTGKQLYVLARPEKQTSHYTCAFTPDSSTVACVLPSNIQTAIHLYDVGTGKETSSIPMPKVGWPWNLFFAPDGKTLFIAGQNKLAGVDVASGKELFLWRMQALPDNSGIKVAPVGGAPVEEQDRAAWRRFIVSPTGTLAAGFLSGGYGRDLVKDRIFLCDVRTGRVIRRWSDSGKRTNGYEELAFSADGRLLATSDFGGVVHVWEVVSGQELFTFKGHRGEVRSVAFSADGRRLASASTDSTVLIWDLLPSLPPQKIDDGTLAALWTDLSNAEAPRAYAAVWQLVAARDAAIAFVQRHIQVVPAPDKEQLRRLVGDLDSDTFAVREKANKELQHLGMAAWPALREALEKEPSAELRRRAEKLLDPSIEFSSSPEELRQVRALHVLEQIGSPQSRELLRKLAAGAAEARLTREAKAALERLERR